MLTHHFMYVATVIILLQVLANLSQFMYFVRVENYVCISFVEFPIIILWPFSNLFIYDRDHSTV